MTKNLLALLIVSGSFSLALLLANSSQATPLVSNNSDVTLFNTPVTVNLSVNSSSINLTRFTQQQQNPILHNLGCTCAACIQLSQQQSFLEDH